MGRRRTWIHGIRLTRRLGYPVLVLQNGGEVCARTEVRAGSPQNRDFGLAPVSRWYGAELRALVSSSKETKAASSERAVSPSTQFLTLARLIVTIHTSPCERSMRTVAGMANAKRRTRFPAPLLDPTSCLADAAHQ